MAHDGPNTLAVQLFRASSPAAHALRILAAMVILAVAVLNAASTYTGGLSSGMVSAVFAAVAVGTPVALHLAFTATTIAQRTVCTIGGIVGLLLCMSASLNTLATERGDHAAERRASITTHDNLTAKRKSTADELAGLAGARTTTEVRASLDATRVKPTIWTTTRQCTDADLLKGKAVAEACKPVLDLRQEMARAIRKTELDGKLGEIDGQLGEAKSPGVADGRVSEVSWIVGRFGFKPDADDVAHAINVGTAIGLEVFAAILSLLAGFVDGARPASRVSVLTQGDTETASPLPKVIGSNALPVVLPIARSVTASQTQLSGTENTIMTALRSAGGRLAGTQRAIAESVGVSRSGLNDALHRLSAAGMVRLTTGAKGTVVELVTAGGLRLVA